MSIWHRTAFEPAVKYLFNSLQVALAHLRWNGEMVDVLSMQICDFLDSCQLFQLLNGTDAYNFLTIVRNPNWDGISPESISAEAPVIGILEPLVKSSFLNNLGYPVGFCIVVEIMEKNKYARRLII